MIKNLTPVVKAKCVLEAKGISGIPAESLTAIADSENIRYKFCELPDEPDLSGELLFRGEKKGIIINTYIHNTGRHNFTFAHELGHYFLNHKPNYVLDSNTGFWCTGEDIAQSSRPQEAEANFFAAELLMPEEQFRLDMSGAPVDFELINGLSKKYQVSKHACSNRILSFTTKPYIIITSSGLTVNTIACSRAAKNILLPLRDIPEGSVARGVVSRNQRQKSFQPTNCGLWLTKPLVAGELYEYTRGGNGYYMTILTW